MNKLSCYLFHDPNMLLAAIWARIAFWVPDALYLKVRYRLLMKKKLNLSNPKTFTEKINWLKIFNKNPFYTTLVDKAAVKEYVKSIIGSEYIIPTLGIWDTFDEINFEKLPEQFVLKTTNGAGGSGIVLCMDKKHFCHNEAKQKLENSFRENLKIQREWVYYDVPPKILAEQYMHESKSISTRELSDYKFYCFNGEPMYCQVIRDRHTNETIDFYDMNWNHMPFVGFTPNAKNGISPVPKPIHLDKLIWICQKLALDIPFARVDLYVIDGKEYFGEITFFPNSGYGIITPVDWDEQLGLLLRLP